MKAKKSFGQHFLVDEGIAKKIASSLTYPYNTLNVLEVGPGKGVLTKYLLQTGKNLKVVEADQDMVHYLNKHYPSISEQVIHLDFLKLQLNRVFDGASFCLIGNYPYNISSQILIKMINYCEYIPEMVGMFQKEVADRVIAPPGSKTYGVISVLVQAHYDGFPVLKVNPGSFSPPPKVDSAVIRMVRKQKYTLPCNASLFRQIVKTTFGQRRKMLRNTLKSMVEDESVLNDAFFNERPEQLSVEDFIQLTNTISKHLKIQPNDTGRKNNE